MHVATHLTCRIFSLPLCPPLPLAWHNNQSKTSQCFETVHSLISTYLLPEHPVKVNMVILRFLQSNNYSHNHHDIIITCGSFGSGEHSRAWSDNIAVLMVNAGDHWSLRMSMQCKLETIKDHCYYKFTKSHVIKEVDLNKWPQFVRKRSDAKPVVKTRKVSIRYERIHWICKAQIHIHTHVYA